MQLGQDQAPAKIAEPIPLEEASSSKQGTYGPLVAARKEELAAEGKTVEEPAPRPKPKDDAEPTAEDKKAFLKAVLGDKQYEKTYPLFDGTLEVTLRDRSTQDTEQMYEKLRDDEFQKEFNLWEQRFMLACGLQKVRFKGANVREFEKPDDLKGRVLELMEFTKPVYMALMETGRLFERHVRVLTSKAHAPDFWKADGSASR